MDTHELVLLSPYRFPAENSLTLADEDMACWLNAWTALWHPALLWQAKEAPRCDSPYDHDQPRPGTIYVLPETPPAYLPDDWDQRVKQAGAIVFKSATDRATTLANLREAFNASGVPGFGWRDGLQLPDDDLAPFFGLGLGHLLLSSLAEAMQHDNLLDRAAFWDDVQQAVAIRAGLPFTSTLPTPDSYSAPASDYGYSPESEHAVSPPADYAESSSPPETDEVAPPSELAHHEAPPLPTDWREPLQGAVAKLVSAREVLYPVTIHLLDVLMVDEKTMDQDWPVGFDLGIPINVVASTRTLETLADAHPDRFAKLKNAVLDGHSEVCGGGYLEREEPLLPLDSQLWNLRYGLDRAKELLGVNIQVYARKRFGYHPHLPLLLSTNGLLRTLFLTFDDVSGLPHYTQSTVSWPSADGKTVDAFVRPPKPADSSEMFFNLGHFWFKTTREDHVATLALLHRGKPDAPWYRDLMELAKLGPLFGAWETFSRYFGQISPGEYPSALSADDFHYDFLTERHDAKVTNPVSSFATHLRTRRRIDACWTYAALLRSLSGARDTLNAEKELAAIEKEAECHIDAAAPAALDACETRITTALAVRLQARSADNQPGVMVLNPCGFARRAIVEWDGATRPIPVEGIVKACQLDGNHLRAIVEVPALGFAWLSREGPPGTRPMASRMKLADAASNTLRNEFFEVEVDPLTGGLKAIRDHKTRINRLGQRLVFHPSADQGRMQATDIKVTSTGPALGEITASGVLLGEQQQVLANFRQRYRVWLGRPLLEMRVELQPLQPPAGYGWHAYYGARFAWRDERATLVRSVNSTGYVSMHPRPQTPDFIDIRTPPFNTTIFTGGLPFHLRQGGRMLDTILVPEGETATVFDFGIALDREQPVQTAFGYASPLAVVPTTKGPPHIGAAGWLFHIDASNLLLTRMTPGMLELNDDGSTRDAVTARFFECAGYSGLAEFRCVRDPQRAVVLDGRGHFLLEANRNGDAINLEVTPNDLVHVQVEF
jgi:hypothetical protein